MENLNYAYLPAARHEYQTKRTRKAKKQQDRIKENLDSFLKGVISMIIMTNVNIIIKSNLFIILLQVIK